MTAVTPGREELEPCPFCAKPLRISPSKMNPSARCVTLDCYGTRMSVVNLDDPESVKSWNTRLAAKPADEGARAATIEECAKIADKVSTSLSEHSKRAEAAGDTQTMYRANTAWHNTTGIAEMIRALSTTGEPKR